MAKKQNFVVGSTNPVTTTDMTDNQLNLAWDRLDVLNAEELNGVLYAISQQSKMNSDEIAAALTAYGITVDPTKNDQMASLMQAINDKISEAATSGKNIGSYWFAKTKTGTTVPAPTEVGQNYIDFTTMQTYESTNGTTWTSTGTLTYDTSVDCFVLITSKFWDITEQSGQQGGEAQWSSTTQSWAYWPKIVDFYNANLTGTPTTTPLTASSPNNQVANKEYVDDIAAGKIDSNTAVLLTGDQTIAGTKTFSSVPAVTTAPTATASTIATQVATTGWVNNSTSATNVVHRSNYEEITGIKTFTQRSQYRLLVTKGTAPLSNQWQGFVFTDQRQTSGTWNAANNIACLQFYYMTDKGTRADLAVYQGVNATDATLQRISIGYNSSNTVYTYAPASDAVNSIVTTTGISKASNGYVKLGNGIIIQWGVLTSHGSGYDNNHTQTATLPTAFSNTNYRVALCGLDLYAGERPITLMVSDKTTTTFTARDRGTTANIDWIAIGY